MLLLLPLAISLPTQAEDNPHEAVVIPDAGKNPDTPGSGNELPQTPEQNLNSNNGNGETPADNPDQPGTPGTPEAAVFDSEVPGIPPAKDVIPFSVKKAPPMMSPGPDDVVINNTNFPDENFRKYVTDEFDRNTKDGKLSPQELEVVTEMTVASQDIHDLKGIEHFGNLQELFCYGIPLTSLDISKNLELNRLTIQYTELTTLDVSKNTKLSYLICTDNQLTELKLAQNTQLSTLSCLHNQLTELDVSQCSALKYLSCWDNQLTELDLHMNTELQYLECSVNSLSTLDVSHNSNLTILYCHSNKISALDISNCLSLEDLSCAINQISSLDVSHNTKLNSIECFENHLTSLDISNNDMLSPENFHGGHGPYEGPQTYSIEVDQDTLEFDLSSLPGSFNPASASDWKGASVSGMTLKLDPSMPATVTYNYDANQSRDGFTMDVTLYVKYVSRNILIPCPYGAVICPTQPAYQTVPITPVPVQQVAQLPKTGEQDPIAVALGSLMLLSLGAFFMISRRK